MGVEASKEGEGNYSFKCCKKDKEKERAKILKLSNIRKNATAFLGKRAVSKSKEGDADRDTNNSDTEKSVGKKCWKYA